MYLIEILTRELSKKIKISKENFIFPSKEGDISCNICFIRNKDNPQKLAEQICSEIKLPEEFEKVESKNGYLNFYIDYSKINLDIKPKKINKNVMVEFSNPNPCKAMHLGHSRTTFLGESISRILEFYGIKVIRANYYNDLGKQIARTISAFKKYGIPDKRKIDHELAEIYAKIKDEEVDERILYELENQTGNYIKEWKFVVENSIKGFKETYKKLNIKFDVEFYESNFKKEGKNIANKLLELGYAFISDGSVVVNLEKYNLPNTVLVRKDGTSLYLTSDIALTIHKFKKYSLDEAIWVVGNEQKLHFKQLFKILEILGHNFKCKHVDYGIISYKGSKMSSRSGRYILLDDLIDELIDKAKKELKNRNIEDIEENAKRIGIGALKYEILKVDRNKNIDFYPGKAIQFEGNTGPYIQYSIIRCKSILKQSNKKENKTENVDEYEKELIKKLLELEDVIEKSFLKLKPNLICNYSFELATTFSRFYENCKVLGDKKEEYRIYLVDKTKKALELCLYLLGMDVPNKM
ncbi:MAG: arginine--tRNA ligase [Candidatus Aenigmarchaeota archaeon ex4484_56]|nr:MAG: arginine--tRNA ligase [Candidatus Aenigmarchaeota archaeon ex4484_56]